jgi:negative regulator of genetic competence, sporulation and motility
MSKSENVTMLDTRSEIYRFERLEELIRAAKIIKQRGGIDNSELFYSEGDGYYLGISERGAFRFGHICEFAIISEYATPVAKEKYPYINEHFEMLAQKEAIELLAEL